LGDTRLGERGEQRVTRELFDHLSATEKRKACRAIDKAPPGTTFFRIAISPDPNAEDQDKNLNLRELTRRTFRVLKEQFPNQSVRFFGAVHGHTENRHVNLLLLLRGRITRKHLKLLRHAADGNAKRQWRELVPSARANPMVRRGKSQTRRLIREKNPFQQRGFGIRRLRMPLPKCPVCKYPMKVEGLSFECTHCVLSLFAGQSFAKELFSSQMLSLRRSREVMGEW
jgi:hypothetical protein